MKVCAVHNYIILTSSLTFSSCFVTVSLIYSCFSNLPHLLISKYHTGKDNQHCLYLFITCREWTQMPQKRMKRMRPMILMPIKMTLSYYRNITNLTITVQFCYLKMLVLLVAPASQGHRPLHKGKKMSTEAGTSQASFNFNEIEGIRGGLRRI